MDNKSQSFLKNWALASILLAASIAAFNAIMDPYLVLGAPRISGLNLRKPAADSQERLMKVYDVLRVAPNTLLLGNSRIELGLDAQDPAWPAQYRPIYNLAIGGAGPYISYRYLQHVMSTHSPDLVLLGLDFEYFLTVAEASHPQNPEFESRFAVTRDGTANADRYWEHFRNLRQATFSLDGMTDSAMTLAANFGGMSFSTFFERATSKGTYPLAASIDIITIKGWRNKEINQFAMADVQAILDLCKSRGTNVILMINPAHADQLEILNMLGYWQEFEDWKRELIKLAAKYPDMNGGSRIPLWDFTSYDSYSTETMLPAQRIMRWFWDPRHYTRALGDVIVRRIFGGGDANFGALISPENIESHLNTIREQQHVYREHHQADVQRLRNLYDSVNGTRPQTAVIAKAQ